MEHPPAMDDKDLNDFHQTMETAAIQSDESSDGFSLVDDGDSLVGSEVYVASEGGASSTPTSATATTEPAVKEVIAPRENQAVCWGRAFVLVVLVLATVSVSVVIYVSAHQAEEEGFAAAFDDTAALISNLWGSRLEQHLEAIEALGVSIASYSSSVQTIWPNVTVPDFRKRSATLLAQSVMLIPIVTDDTRGGWESYSMEHLEWSEDERSYELNEQEATMNGNRKRRLDEYSVSDTIFRLDDSVLVPEDGPPPFLPIWQNSPVELGLINYNLASHSLLGGSVDAVLQSEKVVLSETLAGDETTLWNTTLPTFLLMYPLFDTFGSDRQLVGLLATVSMWSVFFEGSQTPSPVIGVVGNSCNQTFSFQLDGNSVVYLGLDDKHDSRFTSMEQSYDLGKLDYKGEQLLVGDPSVCDYTFRLYPTPEMEEEYLSNRPLLYVVAVVVLAVAVLAAFLLFDCLVGRRQEAVNTEAVRSRKIVASLFPAVVHDRLFQNNNNDDVSNPVPDVAQSPDYQRAIADISTREEENENSATMMDALHSNGDNFEKTSSRSLRSEPPMQRLRNFLSDMPAQSERSCGQAMEAKDEPIADLFPDATVMFADISGFTAWSSVREPAQVFKLLETIYRSFDRTAKKRGVFKVETIGDCYVAVTGLPDPQEDHALIMVKFAKDCIQKMNDLTRKLEVSLGPETGDLRMRFGLHSGPVTAGVLRGEKSRFQLFGDTVNFASRMESTGQRNRIQASQATADLLIGAGKKNWVHPRDELVNAKGKGHVQTYWVIPRSSFTSGSSKSLGDNSSHRSLKHEPCDSLVNLKSKRKGLSLVRDASKDPNLEKDLNSSRRSLLSASQKSQIWSADNDIDIDDGSDGFDDVNRQERLIDWNVEILVGLLKRIVAHRRAKKEDDSDEDLILESHSPGQSLQEITEIIPLRNRRPDVTESQIDPETILLDTKVEDQLREYVTMVACMYRDNFFHNFEHASHVLMSAQKLLKQVITADEERVARGEESMDDYICGITSDPLTQFAIVFSALLHDIDHTGVPNSQLVKENAHIATFYKNKSVAEQNSLDLAWDLLMDRNYRALQSCICSNQAELKRFRQLVVNVVLATDIFDPDMKAIRDSRWEKAFQKESLQSPLSVEDDMNLKATIVIEYVMQASDVSHTMQHFDVYQRWNERLLEEMYSAYQVNRGANDPSMGWYKGELWFFDNYIIPLARKLKECEVFGAASDECLKNALENRRVWATKGEELVKSFVAKHAKT